MAEVKMSDKARKVVENFNPATNIPPIQFIANKVNENGIKEINEKLDTLLSMIESRKESMKK